MVVDVAGDVFVLVRGGFGSLELVLQLAVEEDVMPEIECDLRLPSVA